MTLQLAFMAAATVALGPLFFEVWPALVAGFALCAALQIVAS